MYVWLSVVMAEDRLGTPDRVGVGEGWSSWFFCVVIVCGCGGCVAASAAPLFTVDRTASFETPTYSVDVLAN